LNAEDVSHRAQDGATSMLAPPESSRHRPVGHRPSVSLENVHPQGATLCYGPAMDSLDVADA